MFFSAAQAYIRKEFIDFMNGAYANVLSLLAFVITTLMTIWVLVHGFRIMTGRSNEPLMGFILKAGKAMVICSIAVSAGLFGSSVQDWLLGDGTSTNVGLRGAITETVTGSNDDPYSQVNENLRLTQSLSRCIGE